MGHWEWIIILLIGLALLLAELLSVRRAVRRDARRRRDRTPGRRDHDGRRGMRNGSIACTQGAAKRSSDRLSCTPWTRSPSSRVSITERA